MKSPLDSAVTLESVLEFARARKVLIAPELVGYLALEILESIRPTPGRVDPATTFLSEEGTVAVMRTEGGEQEAETSVRDLVRELLASSRASTPSLKAIVGKESGLGSRALYKELEAALVPMNRAAGRRALARLSREVQRMANGVGRNAPTANPGSIPPPPSAPPFSAPPMSSRSAPSRPPPSPRQTMDTLDLSRPKTSDSVPPRAESVPPDALGSEVDALLGERQSEDVDALLDSFSVSDANDQASMQRSLKEIAGVSPTPPPPERRPFEGPLATNAEKRDADLADVLGASSEPPPAVRASVRGHRERVAMPSNPAPIRKRVNWVQRILATLLVLLLVAGAILLWKMDPGKLTGKTVEERKKENDLQAQTVVAPPRVCRATVQLKDAPQGAEILIRKGQAPIDIPLLPSGVRLEFVATAEGFAPKRTVLTKDAWELVDGKMRAEVAVQLEKTRAKTGMVDPWPPGEPGTESGGKGSPGTAHIVSQPRGAEIWLLAGIGPEATMSDLACADAEFLIAGSGSLRKRIYVREADFQGNADQKTAILSAK
ncbi:MAG: hypothetical protein KBF88_05415 [Polyangiaceae bacterium]|nr:hypothetical protein [Polyangiaceae bacterium]